MSEKLPINNEAYEDLIIRFLDGYASDVEQEQLKRWIAAAPANEQTFMEMRQIWQGADDASVLTELDVDADWKRVDELISKRKPRLSFVRSWQAVAASLLLIALVGSLYLYLQTEQSIKQLSLSDGTIVWLAEGSSLDYPNTFSEDSRIVHLEGKAFFEVAKDAKRPFIINSPLTSVQVLGTSFNVIADAAHTEVIVKTGQVRLSEKERSDHAVTLTPNERGLYQGNNLSKSINTKQNYLSWKTNELVYDGVSIEKVLRELSAHYGEFATLAPGLQSDCALVATFKQDSWKTVLETLENSCDLQFVKKEGIYILGD